MATRRSAALLVLAITACASPRSRPDLLRGAPVAAIPPPAVKLATPAPSGDLMLVDPLWCLRAGLEGAMTQSTLGLIATIVCLPVLVAVDVVAFPILAAVDAGRTTEVTPAVCPISDPAQRAADVLVVGLVSGQGMVRLDPAGTVTPSPGSFRLEVATERFLLSRAISWEVRARLVDATGGVAWEGRCNVATTEVSLTTLEERCEATRSEVSSLGDSCARQWLAELAGRHAAHGNPAPDPRRGTVAASAMARRGVTRDGPPPT